MLLVSTWSRKGELLLWSRMDNIRQYLQMSTFTTCFEVFGSEPNACSTYCYFTRVTSPSQCAILDITFLNDASRILGILELLGFPSRLIENLFPEPPRTSFFIEKILVLYDKLEDIKTSFLFFIPSKMVYVLW